MFVFCFSVAQHGLLDPLQHGEHGGGVRQPVVRQRLHQAGVHHAERESQTLQCRNCFFSDCDSLLLHTLSAFMASSSVRSSPAKITRIFSPQFTPAPVNCVSPAVQRVRMLTECAPQDVDSGISLVPLDVGLSLGHLCSPVRKCGLNSKLTL